ncbi:DUF4240 domain-containing protein [Actinomadura sp. 6N118]|uniref:DUF4240 domain-containing protein n=1 Tax=Actinomadura sp. 6N118 TaxID=3375151 RepID=UPI0037BBC52A
MTGGASSSGRAPRLATGVTDYAYRHPLWNAAYLIEGGCGDDGFMDFRDGLTRPNAVQWLSRPQPVR